MKVVLWEKFNCDISLILNFIKYIMVFDKLIFNFYDLAIMTKVHKLFQLFYVDIYIN